MPLRRFLTPLDDEGSAALEFLTAGLILLVPLVYLMIALGTIQQHTLGAESAARQIARVIAQSPDAETAGVRGDAVLASIAAQYGIDVNELQLHLSCAPEGDGCPAPGAVLTVQVTARAPLPLLPDLFGTAQQAGVSIEASASQKVSRIWGSAE